MRGMSTGAVEKVRAGRGSNLAQKGQLQSRVWGAFTLHCDLVLALFGQHTAVVP